MEPVIVIKYNITQRASGGRVSSFERINVILEFCVTNDIICTLTVTMASANMVQVEKLKGRENFATWNFVR